LIWVVVDCLTKVAHFIPVKTAYFGVELAKHYMSRILCLHGVPKKIISDKRRRDLSFKIGDFVYLKFSPMRGSQRFKVMGKLAPRYFGPFKIISLKGEVTYQLELPPQLSNVHDVFHVSQLKKCLRLLEDATAHGRT
jgi:hypothetical protein